MSNSGPGQFLTGTILGHTGHTGHTGTNSVSGGVSELHFIHFYIIILSEILKFSYVKFYIFSEKNKIKTNAHNFSHANH